MKRTVITYGTFDLFHIGHLNLLKKLKGLGDELIVGVSTDEFNEEKGKSTIIKFEDRLSIVESIKCVDIVIPENSWDQKEKDIQNYNVSIFGIGDDWQGKFDNLKTLCEVVYIPRTTGISTTAIKSKFGFVNRKDLEDLKKSIDFVGSILDKLN
ncbi:adenylyltransferase/cytidyltransferase family protein [Paenalcaligenes suwonensis]|uniref:adenylyltransferase/cytidyltransferase family protein n=1 Tax=Paenalcaligenes suwonensis TaxID=1202713 RepID=UPI00140B2F13|nr:adenylyltransferase/cytidyltransferase family protein [Paenalcaligenes suwonensis]NHC60261.1 adenylyltransferase/cytidyltransferase family protein [Paenalcaligenes suwonensis]